jgi:hypothetical protein
MLSTSSQPARTQPLLFAYFCPEKNQLLRLLLPTPDPSLCSPLIIGIGASEPAPPPLSGLAMRDPAPPKLNPPPEGDVKPRVEPIFAASRRSLTAVSWASNLQSCEVSISSLGQLK